MLSKLRALVCLMSFLYSFQLLKKYFTISSHNFRKFQRNEKIYLPRVSNPQPLKSNEEESIVVAPGDKETTIYELTAGGTRKDKQNGLI